MFLGIRTFMSGKFSHEENRIDVAASTENNIIKLSG